VRAGAAQVLVEAEVLARELLGGEDDLAGVLGEMRHRVVDRFEQCD